MPKQDMRMSEAEIGRFLATQDRGVVVALCDGAAPAGAAARFHYGDGRAGFSLRDDDPVISLLMKDDRACCIVEQFPSYYEIMSVMLHGRARRNTQARAGETRFDLEVEAVVSFDFGKLPRKG
jgi:nitroimidazol reductase NimA-like FMN-containing flavoprotein (pyridoxamine 5'-phosphate oxidase superfamily)